ncbi:hypothetical protein RN001_015329 [Aquatica leii]|uniref:Cx9C motif-containing protein 4 n=1 Tax=Aquatica leii TaxID=1421715 RepID=A0AAN7SNH1_9COLE|nr:hypothetical protein RN001_015329 [Aquatica leii]
MPKKDLCKVFACKIQSCLEANEYKESACKDAFEDMRQCCIAWGTRSFVCEGIKTSTPYKISNDE